MSTSDMIERSLRRGVWAWCALSAVLPSDLTTTVVGLLAIPAGVGLNKYFRPKVTPQSLVQPEKKRNTKLLSYAITAAAGLGLHGTTRIFFWRWRPFYVVSAAFGLSQAYYLGLCAVDGLGYSSEHLYRFTTAIQQFTKAVTNWLMTNPPSQNPLIRYPLYLAGSAFTICNLSFMLVLSVFSDFRNSHLITTRIRLRNYRLQVRNWLHRSRLFRLVIGEQPQFTYPPLEKSTSIRLLKLLPRRPLGGVRGELISVSFEDCPEYVTVSYTWGRVTDLSGMVHIDGKLLPVSPTVEALLYHLSFYTTTRLLWIDQICINQADNEEKNFQVAMMRLIYQHSSCLWVWLDNIKEPFKARTMLAGIWHEYVFGTTESCAELVRNYSQNHPDAGWSQLMNIFAHPWFFRAWVIQEIVLSKSVKVLASWQTIDWGQLATFANIVTAPTFNQVLRGGAWMGIEDDAPNGIMHASVMAQLQDLVKESPSGSTSLSIEFLLQMFANTRSTLAVDRIYGLLGLVDPEFVSKAEWLVPDYSRPTEEVFADVTKNLILQSEDCNNILAYAGIGYQRKLENLPSWVPDWTSLSLKETLRQSFSKIQYTAKFNASLIPPPRLSFMTDSSLSDQTPRPAPAILLIDGHDFDEIVHLSPAHTYTEHNKGEGPETADEIFAVIKPQLASRRLANRHVADPYPLTSEPLDEAFWRTLVANTDMSRPAQPHLGVGVRIWERFITAQAQAALPEGAEPDEELVDETNVVMSVEEMVASGRLAEAGREMHLWNSTRVMCCTGRRFCVTKNGCMAMVPPGSRVGDKICILYGMYTPYVMRCREDVATGEDAAEKDQAGDEPEQAREEQAGEEQEGAEQEGEHHRRRRRVQLVGEAYVHGMMDGLAMIFRLGREQVFEVE